MGKKVLIIGGGIAGLTTGCYLQMNGFESEIFESHSLPGGLCTSWKKGDYTIDGCLHWLVGSNPEEPIHHLWKEIIDIDKLQFHYYSEFFRVRDAGGSEIVAYTNLDRLEQELLQKAPEDKAIIREFIRGARKLSGFRLQVEKAPELLTHLDKLKQGIFYFPFLRTLIRYGRMRTADFARRCKNPLLAKMFEYSFDSEMPILFIMMTFAWLDRKAAGYPIGGSLAFSRLFEEKYLAMGGRIHYGCKVNKILTENGTREERACGIEIENGQQFYSDLVVSAADGHSTIYGLLNGRFVDKRIDHYYRNFKVFPSFIQISIGVAKSFEDIPATVASPLDEPFAVDPEKTIENFYYRIINYDPTLAPSGKTLIICMIKTYNYRYWVDLRQNDPEKYAAEKNRISDFYIDQLDKRLGGIRENLEMVDVSTPATIIRYTHNWKGSFEGWMVTRETGFNSLPKVLPGLRDFYMAGHWVEPGGGVPAVFFSGRNLVQLICATHAGK